MRGSLKKFIIIGITILLLMFSQDSVYGQKTRSMWVWNSANIVSNIINNYGTYRSELFEFCSSPLGNPDHRITHLFFSCRTHVYSNSDNLRDFLIEAVDSGLTIEYLDGDPSWATYNQADGFDRIKKVLEFNDSSKSDNEKIKGIQFDVEPYLLTEARGYQAPYWNVDTMIVWESFVTFLDSCQRMIDSANTDLYFGVAIPRWYENQVGLTELKRLQEKVDYVAIMDYNENASVIINDAANEINNAAELNKKVWIGVETKQVSPETVSFYEEGNVYMESQLSLVNDVYGNNDVFLGFAIHSYDYYRVLPDYPVSVDDEINFNNLDYKLNQNYPNPFNPSTTIEFYLPRNETARLIIYDILGANNKTLVDGQLSKGWHKINFKNDHLPSGIYVYQLSSGNFIQSRKMVLLK